MICAHHPHKARGLCTKCYHYARRNGFLDVFPVQERTQKPVPEKRNVPVSVVINEIEFGTIRKMSDSNRIGMTPLAVERALYRAKRGDLVRRLKEET